MPYGRGTPAQIKRLAQRDLAPPPDPATPVRMSRRASGSAALEKPPSPHPPVARADRS